MKKTLVTGGAGFIGSHVVDLLLKSGHGVRIFDNLELPTHQEGKPNHLSPDAEFFQGDVRNREQLSRALKGMDSVVHLAATGGFTPEIIKFFDRNTIGTATLLELMQTEHTGVERIVVASSVAVYGEGAYHCAKCGRQNGSTRPVRQLEAKQWELLCPKCGQVMKPMATDEEKLISPEKPYSISKFDEERLVLGFGKDYGIHACALRFFLTYGPRQSLTNPYTGILAIFSSRLMNDMEPILFEDGNQTRDFVFVEDVAKAIAMTLTEPKANQQVFNVGTGKATTVREIALILARLLKKSTIEPKISELFRPGEARHIYADISRITQIGYSPSISVEEGIGKIVPWMMAQKDVQEHFSIAMKRLSRLGVVRGSATRHEKFDYESSLSVVVLAYNEAANLEKIVNLLLEELPKLIEDFEIVIVNDGSSDGTDKLAERLSEQDHRVRAVHHVFNLGMGAAIKSGIAASRKNWTMPIPGDLQFHPKDIAKFLEARKGADIVTSYRLRRKDPLIRSMISGIYNFLMKSIYGIGIRDFNWVKMYRREIFEKIVIESRGFEVDSEILGKAKCLNYQFKEIPVEHFPRPGGKTSTMKLSVIFRTAVALVKVRSLIRKSKSEQLISASYRTKMPLGRVPPDL